MMAAPNKKEEMPDGWIEVTPEPSVPEGWKKKMYRMNGRPNHKWVQYYDPQGNRYNTLQSVEVEARKMQQLNAGSGGGIRFDPEGRRDLNPKPVKSAKEIISNCDICNIELNSVQELQEHIQQNHAARDSQEFSDEGEDSLVEDTSPEDPNLKCNECNIQYKKPYQIENHMKKRHGGVGSDGNTPAAVKGEYDSKDKAANWEQLDEDMVDYEDEEELEDEFLENMASQNMAKYKVESVQTNVDFKPVLVNTNSWYASVGQILQRFGLKDYQIPPKMCSLMEHRDEARFVNYVTPLLRSVNLSSKTSTLHILAKAKWFEVMRGQGVTPVNGSLTNLRKPKMIVVNTL